MMKINCSILALAICLHLPAAPFAVIENGKGSGAIVIPEKAVDVEKMAAKELQIYLEKASGVKLPVIPENQITEKTNGYFLGSTKSAHAAGLDASRKQPNTYLIKNIGKRLYITGKDSAGPESSMNVHAGTLFGVYRYLIKGIGVRWLWPGVTGEYVPAKKTILLDSTSDFELKKALRTRIQHKFWSSATPEQRPAAARVLAEHR